MALTLSKEESKRKYCILSTKGKKRHRDYKEMYVINSTYSLRWIQSELRRLLMGNIIESRLDPAWILRKE